MLAMDEFILKNAQNWFVREVLGMIRRTFARLDVTSRSMYAVIEPGSCFVGTLLELALAADRVYMLDTQEGEERAMVMLSEMNFGRLPMVNHLSRLEARFYQDEGRIQQLRAHMASNLRPLRRWKPAWSRPRLMIWTGRMSCVPRSSRASRFRRMR